MVVGQVECPWCGYEFADLVVDEVVAECADEGGRYLPWQCVVCAECGCSDASAELAA